MDHPFLHRRLAIPPLLSIGIFSGETALPGESPPYRATHPSPFNGGRGFAESSWRMGSQWMLLVVNTLPKTNMEP